METLEPGASFVHHGDMLRISGWCSHSASPLYVYSSTFTATPARHEIVQVLSLIIWSLTLIVTAKYVFIILRADNDGEGGTFSCYSLLTRYVRLSVERLPFSANNS